MNRLAAYAINEWIVDIKKNQLPSVMAGVGPMHSIVQLGNQSCQVVFSLNLIIRDSGFSPGDTGSFLATN